ncbi:SMI1/KNR4 family protein [Streptomyces globisporus]|uniref:SMI1/KNR4 family protein n=1 Tax=Streptomyces globisporus TaxID=1908 RepID=UPI00345F9EDC
MTDATPFTWGPFLRDWSGEWSDSLSDDGTHAREDETARRDRRLGFPAAPEERIAALEEHLGRRMPPSYREFLAVSDGWRHAGGFITLLAGTTEARWHNDASGLAAMFEEYLDEDPTPEELRDVAVWRRGLQLDVESDAMSVVLDPGDVDENGEWAVYTWASWRAHMRSLRGRRESRTTPAVPGLRHVHARHAPGGARWSFAFDGDRPRLAPQRFVSPAAAACADARAVVVWGGLRDGHGNPFFHLSVAKAGAELYAFTYADGEVRRTGPVPPDLDPDRFFTSQEERAGTGAVIRTERALLEAIAGEFGVHLPRHAITWGRLHTFTTRSWTRPPQDGETFSVIRFEWGSN